MKTDTTSNSWKSNLFLIAATAAVTTGLMALYNRYQQSKKSQNTETQTDLIQTPPNRAAAKLFPVPQVTCIENVKKKPAAPVGFFQLLSYVNRTELDIDTGWQRDAAPAAQSGAEEITAEPSQPTSPRGALPSEKAAELFGSHHDGSYSLLPSCKNSENDLDRPRTPDNSEARITFEEQKKRGDRMFTEVVKTTAPAATSWLPWPFK